MDGVQTSDAGAALVTLDGVGVRVGGRRLLHDVSLSVRRGEIVTVVGPNGGGKTTLLRATLGDMPICEGDVWRAPGLTIGHMPQRLAVDRTLPLTVGGFLRLGGADRRACEDALERVGAAALERRQLADLSGGETQRALLARALSRKPGLLVLDEPTQALDHAGEAAFYALIERVRQEDAVGVLLVSHDLHVVMAASDHVVCVNGHVCCQGAPAAVAADPSYRRMFGPSSETMAIYRHQHDHTHP